MLTTQLLIDYSDPKLVMAGFVPRGSVEFRKTTDGYVWGRLPFGQTSLHWEGEQILGTSPWGSIDLIYVDGKLSGDMPLGHADIVISATTVSGKLPWGTVDFQLIGRNLNGRLPWGAVYVRLGDHYSSLTHKTVILALAALLSDMT